MKQAWVPLPRGGSVQNVTLTLTCSVEFDWSLSSSPYLNVLVHAFNHTF